MTPYHLFHAFRYLLFGAGGDDCSNRFPSVAASFYKSHLYAEYVLLFIHKRVKTIASLLYWARDWSRRSSCIRWASAIPSAIVGTSLGQDFKLRCHGHNDAIQRYRYVKSAGYAVNVRFSHVHYEQKHSAGRQIAKFMRKPSSTNFDAGVDGNNHCKFRCNDGICIHVRWRVRDNVPFRVILAWIGVVCWEGLLHQQFNRGR